ncbi:MAG TPA: biopolymer transporter ExbD [Rhodothermales bacterium]|nr:biopolymer transporter ExbD [Rhodothermales bacterium]
MPLNFSSGHKPIVDFSLASMTDMVMLLLIFFLLTSAFSRTNALNVNLPDVSAAPTVEEQFVAVTIRADGRTYVDETEVPVDSLVGAISAARGEREAIAIYADEQATIGVLAAAAAAASALDMRVSIATDVAAAPAPTGRPE